MGVASTCTVLYYSTMSTSRDVSDQLMFTAQHVNVNRVRGRTGNEATCTVV